MFLVEIARAFRRLRTYVLGSGLLLIAVLPTVVLAAIGVFFSTLTDSSIGAAGAALFIAIVSQLLDGITLLHAIHPYLLTHDWLAFSDLFRSPVLWTGIVHGVELTVVYTAIFLVAALARFDRKDVTS